MYHSGKAVLKAVNTKYRRRFPEGTPGGCVNLGITGTKGFNPLIAGTIALAGQKRFSLDLLREVTFTFQVAQPAVAGWPVNFSVNHQLSHPPPSASPYRIPSSVRQSENRSGTPAQKTPRCDPPQFPDTSQRLFCPPWTGTEGTHLGPRLRHGL